MPERDDLTSWAALREALYRFVTPRVGEVAAEDVVQDVLVRAYTRRGDLKEASKWRSWLFRIARNAVIDHYRARKPVDPLPAELIEENPDGDDEAGQALARCLVPMLDELPPPYREALKLADIEGMRQRDVADRLGLSVSGAKSRVQRARRMLRDVLLACCRVEVDRRGRVMAYEERDARGGCGGPPNASHRTVPPPDKRCCT